MGKKLNKTTEKNTDKKNRSTTDKGKKLHRKQLMNAYNLIIALLGLHI